MIHLYKKEALIVLFNKEEDEDYFPILITKKDIGGDYYGEWLEFQPELDELQIIEDGDEWISLKEIDRMKLKEELEARGFNVILGEGY